MRHQLNRILIMNCWWNNLSFDYLRKFQCILRNFIIFGKKINFFNVWVKIFSLENSPDWLIKQSLKKIFFLQHHLSHLRVQSLFYGNICSIIDWLIIIKCLKKSLSLIACSITSIQLKNNVYKYAEFGDLLAIERLLQLCRIERCAWTL